MIVLDNSALIEALVSPGSVGRSVVRRIEREWVAAPELIDVEAASTIRGLVLGRKLTLARADHVMRQLGDLAIERFPHRMLLSRIWELRDNLTAYDAAYVALAELLGASLVTGDHKFLDAPGVRCPVEVVG